MKNWALGIMLALIGLCVLWWLRGYMVRYMVIENHSGQTITRVEVVVIGRTIRHSDIKPGETRWGTFPLNEDAWIVSNGRFELIGTLADGTTVRSVKEAPIVTNGRVRALFKIESGGNVDFSYQ